MSYQISNHSLDRVKVYLDLLLKTPNQDNSFFSENPHNLAYLLRQGLAAAKKLNIPPYAQIDYTFRARRDRVIAECKSLSPPSIRFFQLETEDEIATTIIFESDKYEKTQFPFHEISERLLKLCASLNKHIQKTTNAFNQPILEVTHVVRHDEEVTD